MQGDPRRLQRRLVEVTALAELSTRQIAETVQATGTGENQEAAHTGGTIARNARLDLEDKTGRAVVSGENYLPPASAKPKTLKGKRQKGAAERKGGSSA